MIQSIRALGTVLLLGGLAHSAGVARLYATTGVPDANRVLLDMWIAQAQLLSGGLYLAAARMAPGRRNGAGRRVPASQEPGLGAEPHPGNDREWRALAGFGALTIITFSVAMLPVLIARAPLIFRVPPIAYSIASLAVLWRLSFRISAGG